MEDLYRQLIDRQRAKIEALKEHIAKIEERIVHLTEMAAEDGNSVLALTTSEPLTAGADSLHKQSASAVTPQLPKRRPANTTLMVLQFIGIEGKSLDELQDFSNRNNIGMDRRALRTFANLYRTRFDVLESEPGRQGFFKLTAPGAQYLQNNPPSIPTEGGHAATEGVREEPHGGQSAQEVMANFSGDERPGD